MMMRRRGPGLIRAAATTAVAAIGRARFHSGRAAIGDDDAATGAPPGGSASMYSISARTSPMACHRWRRDFARHRCRSLSIRGSIGEGSALQSGSRASTDARMSLTVSPGNACRPVRSS